MTHIYRVCVFKLMCSNTLKYTYKMCCGFKQVDMWCLLSRVWACWMVWCIWNELKENLDIHLCIIFWLKPSTISISVFIPNRLHVPLNCSFTTLHTQCAVNSIELVLWLSTPCSCKHLHKQSSNQYKYVQTFFHNISVFKCKLNLRFNSDSHLFLTCSS